MAKLVERAKNKKIRKYKPRGYWTKENIINRLRALAAEHGENYLRVGNLRKKECDLWGQMRIKFGSHRKAIEAAGFNYGEIAAHKVGYWTKENIINRLRALAAEHGENYLRVDNLQKKEGDLAGAMWKEFGSIKEAIEAAGFDYLKIRGEMFGNPKIWRSWEKCCKEIAEVIYPDTKIYPQKRLGQTKKRPDLQIPEKKLIIDSKTNAWEVVGIEEDTNNYLPYCQKLEFWCLEGDRKISTDAEIVNGEDLLKRLKDKGVAENTVAEFKKKILQLKHEIDPYAGYQKEISTYDESLPPPTRT